MTTPLPSGSLGLLQQLESTWHLRRGDMQGLELLEVIGRGGSATVLKGGWQGAGLPPLVQAGRACVLLWWQGFQHPATVLSHPGEW